MSTVPLYYLVVCEYMAYADNQHCEQEFSSLQEINVMLLSF